MKALGCTVAYTKEPQRTRVCVHGLHTNRRFACPDEYLSSPYWPVDVHIAFLYAAVDLPRLPGTTRESQLADF